MPTDNSKDGGQSESTTGKLRRKERIEHSALCDFVHSRTGIADFEKNAQSWFEFSSSGMVSGLNIAVIYFLSACRDCHRSRLPFGDRLRAIDDDVHDELLNLGGVRFNRNTFFKLESQFNSRGHRGLNQRGSLPNRGGQIDSLNEKASPSRISKHLPRQLRSLLAGFDNVLHTSPCRRTRLRVLQRKTGVS